MLPYHVCQDAKNTDVKTEYFAWVFDVGATPQSWHMIRICSPSIAARLFVWLQELAWASYALLRNTNTCGVAVFSGQQAVMARGALGGAAGADGAQARLQAYSKVYTHAAWRH